MPSARAKHSGRPAKTHKLEASPTTVAYGYYSATATPVLRIASGDVIEVTTMLTNTPERLERAGVAPNDIEPELARSSRR